MGVLIISYINPHKKIPLNQPDPRTSGWKGCFVLVNGLMTMMTKPIPSIAKQPMFFPWIVGSCIEFPGAESERDFFCLLAHLKFETQTSRIHGSTVHPILRDLTFAFFFHGKCHGFTQWALHFSEIPHFPGQNPHVPIISPGFSKPRHGTTVAAAKAFAAAAKAEANLEAWHGRKPARETVWLMKGKWWIYQ